MLTEVECDATIRTLTRAGYEMRWLSNLGPLNLKVSSDILEWNLKALEEKQEVIKAVVVKHGEHWFTVHSNALKWTKAHMKIDPRNPVGYAILLPDWSIKFPTKEK